MVIAEPAYLTPLWHELGAVDVMALVENAEQGAAALGRGASKWLQHDSSVADIASALRSQTVDTSALPHFTSESHPTTELHVPTDAEHLEALDEFLPEEVPSGDEKPFHAIPIPPIEQNDSTTVLLRPAKDRRRARRRHRTLPSRRAFAAVALTAVLGAVAYFTFSSDSAPALPGPRPPATLSESPMRDAPTVGSNIADSPVQSVAALSPGGTVTSVEPGSADAPSPEHAGAVPSRQASQDLTGSWAMTNEVQTSRYRPYQGLRIGYRLQLRHEGTRISGEGHKWLENGRAIPRVNRTPIRVSGVVEGRRIVLTFSEDGRRRQSHGRFDLQLTAGGVLRGKFESDAARSRGSSVAQRVRIDEVANKPR